MTEELDYERIQHVVKKCFRYVTLSHVWGGKEPSFQDVNLAGSVWELDSSPLNEKLRQFCEVVRSRGYQWAWSDTCCIDKTNSTVLNQSLTMMYKWYETSSVTFVHLVDVMSPSALGDLTGSIWMKRAWTAQELLAAKAIRFYTRDWKPYLGDTRADHKKSPKIMQELADAIGIARTTIIAFNPDDLTVREKLRLASTRNATVEEDVAYSLIGLFKSDIIPRYGEGDAALGHLLEETVARLGEVTVLAWSGESSTYNSCLPAAIAVYRQPPHTLSAIENAKMEAEVSRLRRTLSREEAIQIYDKITDLPAAQFSNRRLRLPCIIFSVRKLDVQDFGRGREYRYRARVPGIGNVEFQTLDRLSQTDPHNLIFIHPWIRHLFDPLPGLRRTSMAHGDDDNDEGRSSSSGDRGSPASTPSIPESNIEPLTIMDDYTHTLKIVARLQHPFHALLLQQQSSGEFKRVAAEHEIIVPGIEPKFSFVRDFRAAVVDVL